MIFQLNQEKYEQLILPPLGPPALWHFSFSSLLSAFYFKLFDFENLEDISEISYNPGQVQPGSEKKVK